MELLHTAFIIKAKINFEEDVLENIAKRNLYTQKKSNYNITFLEILKEISESISIKTFLAKKIYKFDSLGKSPFERAKINK